MSMITLEQSYKLLEKFTSDNTNPIISALYHTILHVRNLAFSGSVHSFLKTKCISLITGVCRVLGNIQSAYRYLTRQVPVSITML